MTEIVALSGGKDSTAMALRLQEIGGADYEYVCTPTGDELPEMSDHWRRLEELLGKPLLRVTAEVDLVGLTIQQGMLPNWRARFCTKALKIWPFQSYLSERLPATSYVGLRADEDGRSGVEYGMPLLVTVRYPLQEWGWGLEEVLGYLDRRGVSVPERTDCARCFYQTISEWRALWKDHPDIYQSAVDDEIRTGHTYRSPSRDTWPAALEGLRSEFEGGRLPIKRKRKGGCRICTL